jgi:hypothetical protein
LQIVNALADRWGHDLDIDGHNEMWVELTW